MAKGGAPGALDSVDGAAAQQQHAGHQHQHADTAQVQDAGHGKGGGSAEVLQDPALQPFLQPDFNAAEFTSRALAASRTSAQAQAEQLKVGVRHLEAALSGHVIANHQELLQHARRLADTEHSLQDVVLSVASLQSSVKRIRSEVEGPYGQVRSKTRQLSNLHAAVELLRHLGARLKLTTKLRQQLAPPPPTPAGATTAHGAPPSSNGDAPDVVAAPGHAQPQPQQPAPLDLAKAAKLLADIRALGAEADLAGLEAAAADEPFLAAAGAEIHDAAQAHLIEGMSSQSQAKVGSALQVFFNLGELNRAVDGVLAQHLHDLERSFKQALDSRHLSALAAAAAAAGGGGGSTTGAGGHGPGGGAGGPGGARGLVVPAPGAAGSWQDKLWSCLRAACDGLATSALAVWHLGRVVAKKRDPITQVLFLDLTCPPGSPTLTERFWSEALRLLGEVFAGAARPSKGGFVRDALGAGYPRLVALLEGTGQRILTDSRIKGVAPAMSPAQLPALLDVAAPFRDAYLGSGLGRLTEAVAAAFPGSSRALPSPADVQKCIGLMHEQLKAAGASAHLAGLVGGAVGQGLRLLAEKAEYMAAAGPELRLVSLGPAASSGASQAQQRNIALCSQLQEVHRSLSSLLPRLPDAAATALSPHLAGLHSTAVDMVAPIFKAAMDMFETHITAMHQQQWGPTAAEQQAAAAATAAAAGAPPGSEGDGQAAAAAAAAAVAAANAAAVTDTSVYVSDLANAIAVFRCEYLLKFVPPPSPSVPSVCSSLAERAAGRLLMLWARHACLVGRPLGPGGKLALAKDLGELQMVVGQGLFPLEPLGPAHRCLRALRALLFTDDASLPSASCLHDLPPSLVLLHCFSRLPPGIKTPAERSGLSPAQYSRWLDQHSTADVARSVASALEAAKGEVAAAEGSGDEGVRAVLGLMRQLCGM